MSSAKNEKNGLPGLDKLPSVQNRFTFERLGYIYFLSTNTQQNVIKYNIYGKHHRVISDSKINNKHVAIDEPNSLIDCNLEFKPHGVQIGEFYWIILGCSNTGCFFKTYT